MICGVCVSAFPQEKGSSRLLSLDVARGIAALCVVVFHWSHFIMTPAAADERTTVLPFWRWLHGLYAHGGMGVDFFFVLSGAIFFLKYADRVSARSVGAWTFFVLRFSRLYPLYAATLIAAALLQAGMTLTTGRWFAYESLSWWRVATSLFGIAPEFRVVNMPAWTLIVEAQLYVTFFVVFRFAPATNRLCLTLAIAGITLRSLGGFGAGFGQGLWCFFLGGLLARHSRAFGKRARAGLFLVTMFLVAIAIALPYETPAIPNVPAGYFSYSLAFVGIVASLSLIDSWIARPMRLLSWLGDISYSSYLLHFPLQIAFALAVALWFGRYNGLPFNSSLTFIGFFAVLIPLSLACYAWFETPTKLALRRFLLPVGRIDKTEAVEEGVRI